MELLDVVMKINGPVLPVGDSHVDEDRLVNLKALCDLTIALLVRIACIADATDDHMASVKAAKDVAVAFFKEAREIGPPFGAEQDQRGCATRQRIDALINDLEYAVLARSQGLPGSAEKLTAAKQAIRDASSS